MSLQDELTAVLEDMAKQPGIVGAVVANRESKVLASKTPAVYESAAINELTSEIVASLLHIEEMDAKIDEIIYDFDDSRLMARDIGNGCLIVFALKTAEAPLLRFITNAARKRVSAILARSGAGGDGGRPGVSRNLSPDVIRQILFLLAQMAGPAAIIISKHVMDELSGQVQHIPEAMSGTFVKKLSEGISDPTQAEQFRKAASQLLPAKSV